MKKDDKKTAINEQTPITDGDTRPDQIVEQDPADVKKAVKEKNADGFTINRKRDVNSLEDHKDAI
jgi:hypothetical protein